MTKQIREIQSLETCRKETPDDVFICCASFEERCLGSIRLFSNYRHCNSFLFVYDEPDEKREIHLHEMKQRLNAHGNMTIISASEGDPAPSVATLGNYLRGLTLKKENCVITMDISTFTKRHLLLLLNLFDRLGYWNSLRVMYTEPGNYVTNLYLPMSFGVKAIETVSGFVANQSLGKPLLLVIFLGYEGDRANALFKNIDPNETVLIIPKPAYHPEWEGRTEEMNVHLISMLREDALKYADSRNPYSVFSSLCDLFERNRNYDLRNWHCCISPLGTKPQTLGLYQFWREFPYEFSIIYAQSLKHNETFYSDEIGRTWELMIPELA